MTSHVLAIGMLLTTAVACWAAPLRGAVELFYAGQVTADPRDGADLIVDAYAVLIDNPNDAAVTSLEFRFPGEFIDNFNGNFAGSFDSPVFLGPDIADSFFIVPPGYVLAAREVIDSTKFEVAYTLAGDYDLITANSKRTLVAKLSIPTGRTLDSCGFLGNAILRGGVRETIRFIPEPSGALLVGLVLVGCFARREPTA